MLTFMIISSYLVSLLLCFIYFYFFEIEEQKFSNLISTAANGTEGFIIYNLDI
jgi:hypothetical protein